MAFGERPERGARKFEVIIKPESREAIAARMAQFIEKVREQHVDSLVFLEKSARPLSWLFRAAWKKADLGAVPDVSFVNVGQRTSIRKGAADFLASAPFRIDLSESERNTVDKKLEDAARKDRWVVPQDIPIRWAKQLARQDEYIALLQKSFHNAFDGRSVLILDEVTMSGRSQMATLGLFSHAFPHAKALYSSGFFYGDAGFEQLSWYDFEGYSDVIEGEDPLFSMAITDENLQKIRQLYKERSPSYTLPWEDESAQSLRVLAKRLRSDMDILTDDVAARIRTHPTSNP